MDELIIDYIPQIWHLPIKIGVILLATTIIAAVTARLFNSAIRKTEQGEGESHDLTNLKFLKRGVSVLIYLTGISFAIYMVPSLRVIATSLLAGAGLFAVAVGFASQQALSNIIGGIFIVIFKPYKINDRLQIRTDLSGVVEDINLRHTVIRNFENKRIIIPNSVISDEVLINSNYGDDKIIKWIDVGISYDSDIDLARKIMQEEVEAHPNFIDNRNEDQLANGDPKVPVRLLTLGDFSVNLRAWATAADPPSAFVMGTDLLESIKKRFDKEGIEIPFPYRTIVYKKDLENLGQNLPTDHSEKE
ncbi:MAG: mechanosensitive ion channel family protein [Balneolaceae bacterium]|nr:mechanosensitive ion channel family protein [Balneolaceae bacterium]MBO6546429.1 mechanosensitive ion channel family protein [Balneolaceae bacterium]MBO6648788.1 mechanosensitive ion channel family protein [Balneolaceae bacterium]